MLTPKDIDTSDLITQLEQATAPKSEGPASIDDIEGPKPDKKDFEPEQPRDPLPSPTEPVKTEPPMSKEEQARLMVGFVDGLDVLILPWAYQKTIFTDSERARLTDLKRKIGNAGSKQEGLQLDAKETELYSKYSDYTEITKNIPFDDKESSMLIETLAAVMKKYNKDMGPEGLFLGALGTVMLPRLMPLFTKLGNF